MQGQRWPVVASLVSLVLLLLAAAPPAPKQAPFSLALLRRDGLLLPFASYDGRWKNNWPPAGHTTDMPLSAADIPKAWWPDKKPITEWNLIPIGNGPINLRSVQVNAVNWYRAGCIQGVGLITNYKPLILPPPPRVRPYPKDALAYSGEVTIDRIDMVGPKDTVVGVLNKELPDEITPQENGAIEALTRGHGFNHSYSTEERKNVPISLEALYRVPKGLDGRNLYYFEAVKRYFLPKDDRGKEERTCDLVTFVSGFFSLTKEGLLGDLNAKVVISSCDYAQARFMLPLGTVVIDDVRHWIVQWSNPSFETYAILKPSLPTGTMLPVFEVGGGVCARENED